MGVCGSEGVGGREVNQQTDHNKPYVLELPLSAPLTPETLLHFQIRLFSASGLELEHTDWGDLSE